MLEDHKAMKKGVKDIMGGKVLELSSEKLIKKGRAEGRAEGRTEGEIKGRLEQAKQVYDNCIARGMSAEDANALSGYADLKKENK